MKKCYVCGHTKRRSQFNKHKTGRDGLQAKCKPCKRKDSRRYYRKNAKHMRKSIQVSRRKRIEDNYVKLLKILEAQPCVDCGETDPIVLDFDHVKGNKLFDIGTHMSCGHSWARTVKEMKKCVVRCANCHRRKTAREGNHRRLQVYNRLRRSIVDGPALNREM